MSYCSPNINVTNHYTCFEHDELKEIALALNIYIQKNKLCLLDKSTSKTCSTKIINIGKKTKKQLWYSIYNRLKIICPYEYCWVDLDFINNIKDRYLRDKIRDFTFKPKGPKTANSWLWTEDINRVLQQYGSIDKTFKFLGALPSDFYKITKMNWTNICNYNKFSIVFNLDNHKQSGSHWVAFLIDNKTKTIEYYDSIGNLPNTNINVFIKHVQNFLHKKCKINSIFSCFCFCLYYFFQKSYQLYYFHSNLCLHQHLLCYFLILHFSITHRPFLRQSLDPSSTCLRRLTTGCPPHGRHGDTTRGLDLLNMFPHLERRHHWLSRESMDELQRLSSQHRQLSVLALKRPSLSSRCRE